MAQVARQEKVYTIDDIYTLPDGERAELIDGQIYYMAPPGTKHQRLVHFFGEGKDDIISCYSGVDIAR